MSKPEIEQDLQFNGIGAVGVLPPQALDAEDAVLGGILIDKEAIHQVIDRLNPESFYKTANELIYKSVLDLYSKGISIDLVTITENLRAKNNIEKVGGAYYVATLTNRVTSSANIEHHAAIVAQKSMLREVILTSNKYSNLAFENGVDAFEVTSSMEKDISEITSKVVSKDISDAQTLAENFDKELDRPEGEILGIPTCLSSLDIVLKGWQNAGLYILAARPGMGKSAFAIKNALDAAMEAKKSVAFFSLEMPKSQIVSRIYSIGTGIPHEYLAEGNSRLSEMDIEQKNKFRDKFMQSKFFLDDTAALQLNILKAKLVRLKAKHGLDFAVIDYLQLMKSGQEMDNREQEISEITRTLKSYAKELDIPILALAQLSRAVEQRTEKRPLLSDLRESGSIEQDADAVLFIYRPEYYKILEDAHGESTEGLALIDVAKNRNGRTGDVEAHFKGETMTFTSKYQDYDSKI